jgi:DNA-binding response OmpR family regulator
MLIEFDKRMVSVWNDRINFTRKEYDIFLHLVANKDKVVSKLELAEYSWGDTTDQMDSFNILSAHIKNIRKKMKEAKAETEIRNSYGVGYQIIEL